VNILRKFPDWLWITVLGGIFFLPFLGSVRLFDWDEVNFAESAREMIVIRARRGGIEANKHEHKKLKAGRGAVGKTPVLGMRERGKGGRTKAMKLSNTDAQTIQDVIVQNVQVGSTLHTDEHGAYRDMGGLFFSHESINHSEGEFIRDGVTTNSIESVFAVLKRGMIGVYHHASAKHLGRYVDEFAFRLNDGDVKRHTLDRLDSLIDAAEGKRLTYKRLIQ
jgi:hypothetical protein